MIPFDSPEYSAFIEAIRQSPDCDLPRLVAADFLEERGESERAEFIRVQCEIAELERGEGNQATDRRRGLPAIRTR